ncbi:CRTAC1 family protein [Maioricimonas rarisocia]|nr:CRTAC1 family protein [Maioricimonas rarisocia]
MFSLAGDRVVGWCPAIGLLALMTLGCTEERVVPTSADPARAPEAVLWFEDATDELGIEFRHETKGREEFSFPASVSAGAAWIDYDQDGRLDLYLIQNGGPDGPINRLYHQQQDGRFKDVSEGSGLDVAGYGQGVAVGDVNNDGWPDVCVTEYDRTRLFLNEAGQRFAEVTEQAGIDNPSWGTSAAFVDYDRDGWLDLVVANYVEHDASKRCFNDSDRQDFCGPDSFHGSVPRLYRNRTGESDGRVRFEDVTSSSGLAAKAEPGLGVVCLDFDGDRWPDLLLANDGRPNTLWINQKDGTFLEEAILRGLAFNRMGETEANMGLAVGDVDRDGLFDVFVTHLVNETHTLWRQSPRGYFEDATVGTSLSTMTGATGFGTVMEDFDHDGDLDIAIATGGVLANSDRAAEEFWDPYRQPNQLFANIGNGTFRDVGAGNAPFCTSDVARALAHADFDNDGDVDLVLTRIDGHVSVYRNVSPKSGHWLIVRAIDPDLNRDAYGAGITLIASSERWSRAVSPGQSYESSADPRVHFGLGDVDRLDAIRVIWPDGTEEEFPGAEADQVLVIEKGTGREVPADLPETAAAKLTL